MGKKKPGKRQRVERPRTTTPPPRETGEIPRGRQRKRDTQSLLRKQATGQM